MNINGNQINLDVINADDSITASTLLAIEKNISERIEFSGSLLTIEKELVATQASYSLLTIGKLINNAFAVGTFYDRNDWDVHITINGFDIDSSILTGGVKVIKQEDDNHSAEFTIILEPDIYDLYTFQGGDVQIFIRTADEPNWKCVFTGVVDVPKVNVIEEKLTLACIADRRVLLRNISSIAPYIGYYDETVSSKANDNYEQLMARLLTVPSSIDFDGNNNFILASWTPKASPDYIYGSGDVYRKNPQLTIESADKIINTVDLTLEYGFQRLHERMAGFTWKHPYAPINTVSGEGGICPFLQDRPSIPTRDMIRQAINAVDWQADENSIAFGKQFKSGTYLCNGNWVLWSTIETGYLNAPLVDGSGNPVNDASGNPLYRSVQTNVADNTDIYTMNAQWRAKLRFNQNIRETYTITVQAPTSVNTYGELVTTESYGFTSKDQYTNWERSKTGDFTIAREVDGTNAKFYDGSVDRYIFNNAFITALNKAKTTILKSHRDTRINFQRFLTPSIELYHTIELVGKWIRGKGKCNRIEHNMCISECAFGAAGEAYTDVTLVQYRGTTTFLPETNLVPAPPPLDDVVPPQAGISLQTHLGIDPSTPGSEKWNGYVGNIRVDQVVASGNTTIINHTRTTYQESFTVDTPAIPSDLRDERINSASATYNINIPTDSTVYESYG